MDRRSSGVDGSAQACWSEQLNQSVRLGAVKRFDAGAGRKVAQWDRYAFGTVGRLGNLSGRLEAGPWREWNVVSVTRTSDPLRSGTELQLDRQPVRPPASSTSEEYPKPLRPVAGHFPSSYGPAGDRPIGTGFNT
jgi:hypothetical protein